jgi:multicomponent Na+:H+ antiporter subunit G
MNLQVLSATILLVFGCCLSLLACIGLIRMPDLYMRMQSATKAGTLGVACIALAAAIVFADGRAIIESILVVLFLFFTAPVASYMVARAADHSGMKAWTGVGPPPDDKQ